MWPHNWIMVFCNSEILSAHKNKTKNIFSQISFLTFVLSGTCRLCTLSLRWCAVWNGQCSLFWDYIPESKLCFCLNHLRRSPGTQSIRPIQKLHSCQTTTRNQKQLCGSEFAKWHDIYTPEECADEWRQNNADLKLLENFIMNGFIIFGIRFMTATGLENSPQSFDVYPNSRSRSVVTSAENPAPDN